MRIYDPSSVILTVGGSDIEGFAQGSFITVQYNADAFAIVVGSRGDVARSKSSNRSARITVRLMQTSPSNDLLSTLHNLDLSAPNGAGVFALALRDGETGRAVHTAVHAWIVKFPDINYDMTDTAREWVIETDRLEAFVAGAPAL